MGDRRARLLQRAAVGLPLGGEQVEFRGDDDGVRQARVALGPGGGEARVAALLGRRVLVVEPGHVLPVQERRLEGVHAG